MVRTVLLSTNLPRFDKTILSVICLHFKYAFDSAAGRQLFLFPLRNHYIVFLATIHPFWPTVETEQISNVYTCY